MKKIKGIRPNQVPDDILTNPLLIEKISLLPSNYNFEVPKTL